MAPGKSSVAPSDPCPCSSGLTYAECHQEIDAAPAEELLKVSHQAYARRWRGNATSYESQGLYDTLAQHLFSRGEMRRVIDLGCGRGEGMCAIRAKMPTSETLLIGIYENPDCLAAAAGRLGIAPPQKRLRRTGGGSKDYGLEAVPGLLPSSAPLMLVQSDLLRPDEELDDRLLGLPPFDAVTLWFSGTHAARPHDTEVIRQELHGDAVLRQATELAAVEFASNLVRPGGLLQIVTRGGTNHLHSFESRLAETMRELAGYGRVTPAEVRMHPYDEPHSGDRIGVAAPGSQATSDHGTYVASALFIVR